MELHSDFDETIDYIVEKAGNINYYDIKADGTYHDLLDPYLKDK